MVRRAISSFRRQVHFPSEGASLPGWIPGVGWSDQWSFWQQGYQGIMITDTAPYRYPYSHTEQDTLDKINFDKLARVLAGLAEVIFDGCGVVSSMTYLEQIMKEVERLYPPVGGGFRGVVKPFVFNGYYVTWEILPNQNLTPEPIPTLHPRSGLKVKFASSIV